MAAGSGIFGQAGAAERCEEPIFEAVPEEPLQRALAVGQQVWSLSPHRGEGGDEAGVPVRLFGRLYALHRVGRVL